MEQEESLDLNWLPEQLDGIFEDCHAAAAGQWEFVQSHDFSHQAA
ncbi:hypothetical protein [Alcanivorax sp.]|jgi:hypothetical protein